MTVILIILLAIVALAGFKYLPTFAVLGVVTLIAALLRSQARAASAGILAFPASNDPWASPSREARRLMKKSLSLSLSRTELAACFAGRGL